MIVKTTKRTIIEMSVQDIHKLIETSLEQKGYHIEHIQSNIETKYDGSLGDPGTDVFAGVTITANIEYEEHEID